MLLKFYIIYSFIWFQNHFAKYTLEVTTFISNVSNIFQTLVLKGLHSAGSLLRDEVLALPLLMSLLMVFKDEL